MTKTAPSMGKGTKQGKKTLRLEKKLKKVKPAKAKKFFSKKVNKGWHERTMRYWRKQKDNLVGVTGGGINDKDLIFSKSFVEDHLLRYAPKKSDTTLPSGTKKQTPTTRRFRRCLDAGAGIGRVTGGLLQHHSEHVDLLEPMKHLLTKARQKLGGTQGKKNGGCKFGYICSTMQKFKPARTRMYDLVWCQWMLMYVSDEDAVEFLRKLGKTLTTDDPRGIIVVKENLPDPGQGSFFDDESEEEWKQDGTGSSKRPMSVTRTAKHYEVLFKKAGLQILKKQLQNQNLGNDNHMVTYALRLKKEA